MYFFRKFVGGLSALYSGPKAITLLVTATLSLFGGWVAYRVAPGSGRIQTLQQGSYPPRLPPTLSLHGNTYDLATLTNPLRTGKEELERHIQEGGKTYFTYCFFCHGDKLRGKGHYAHAFTPRPTNFMDPKTGMGEAYLFWRIATGGDGLPEEFNPWDSAMPAFHSVLDEREIWQVILFLHSYTGRGPALPPLAEPQEERSKSIYAKRCLWCHGEKGKGDGPAAQFLNPPPRDLSAGVYKYVSAISDGMLLASDKDIFRTISNGMPGTAMPGWKDILAENDIRELVTTVKGFSDLFTGTPPPQKIPIGEPAPYTEQSVARGREIYTVTARCYECHGQEGRGYGGKRLKQDDGSRVWPRNHTKPWTFRGGNAPEEIFTRVTTGIPGTPMPSFSKALTPEERLDVANYVISLGDETHRPKERENTLEAQFVTGELPANIYDPRWDPASSAAFALIPNVLAGSRLFTPTNDSVKVRAFYNRDEIVILLEWADRTKSLPGDQKIAEVSEKEFYKDAAAIEFPAGGLNNHNKPWFGHGGRASEVTIWYWNSGSFSDPQKRVQMNRAGIGETEPLSPGTEIRAKGLYREGLWRVLFRRSLKTERGEEIQFEPGRVIPIAFANWDGSNGEKGSKHTFTPWKRLILGPLEEKNRGGMLPIAVALALAGIQFLFAKICSGSRLKGSRFTVKGQ